MSNTYQQLLFEVLEGGQTRSPRGLRTKEGDTTVFGGWADLMFSTRTFNPALAATEALCLLSGNTDRNALRRVAPKTFEAGYFTHRNINYGERVGLQLEWVVRELLEDKASRRAVVTLSRENDLSIDRPCPMVVQFSLDGGYDTLWVKVVMRSWDLVRGLPYDFMLWGIVVQAVARSMDLTEMPWLEFVALKPHVYLPCDILGVRPERTHRVTLTTPLGMSMRDWRGYARDQLHYPQWVKAHPTTSWRRLPDCLEVSTHETHV